MRLPKSIRTVLAWTVSATLAATLALFSTPQANAATETTYRVTASTVQVRAGRSTKTAALGALSKGYHVLAKGKARSGWQPITYNGKTGWVPSKYLTKDRRPAASRVTGPAGSKTALMQVTVRTAPVAGTTAIKDYPKGTVMRVTGKVRGIFTRVSIGDVKGWASTRRLTATTSVLPPTVATYVTTDSLALRTTAAATATSQLLIPTGSTVAGTGVNSGSYTQVVYANKLGWVITGYLTSTAGTDAKYLLPLSTTTLYVTTYATLFAGPSTTSARAGAATLGSILRGTGTIHDTFTQVIWNGTTAWISSRAVIVSLGSTSLDRLESNGKAAVIELRKKFPQITTIYGWRASSDYSSDHPNGRAVDFMIPSYKSNKALGDALAAYVIANGPRLHMTYVIWQQRIWTPYSGKWRAMEDRGSDTANHMDHVHVSFEPSSK
jgi:uncharacterized protein YgiM (DUF1202 family)